MTKYIISPEAIRDLKLITNYLGKISLEKAEKLLNQFNKKCANLVRFPKIGRSYSHIRSYLRGLPLDGYIIFYRLNKDTVEIMRVIKGDRNLDVFFSGENDN